MPKGIYKNKTCKSSKVPEFTPNKHQILIRDYLLHSPFKGLLLYHQLGSGKTCSSIITADNLLNSGNINHVFICTPGSLRTNWLFEYCNTCGIGSENLRKNYTFITYNYDISDQLLNEDFNNSLVIVDEFHNLINGVKNQTKTFLNLYNKINDTDCRVLLLSGTPLIKEPAEEWSLILKLLDPNSYDSKKSIPDLKGLVSYFETDSQLYPPIYYKDPIKVNMTIPQQHSFREALKFEGKKISNGAPDPEKYTTREEFKKAQALYILSMKHFFSRKISNFYYPSDIAKNPDVLNTEKSSELPSVEVQKAADEELKQVMMNENPELDITAMKLPSPKPKPLLGWVTDEALSEHKLLSDNLGTKHMIYSIFKIKGGVILLHTLFSKCGIKSAIFSGDLNDSERTRLLNKFNSPENRNGEIIRV